MGRKKKYVNIFGSFTEPFISHVKYFVLFLYYVFCTTWRAVLCQFWKTWTQKWIKCEENSISDSDTTMAGRQTYINHDIEAMVKKEISILWRWKQRLVHTKCLCLSLTIPPASIEAHCSFAPFRQLAYFVTEISHEWCLTGQCAVLAHLLCQKQIGHAVSTMKLIFHFFAATMPLTTIINMTLTAVVT